MSTLSDSVFIEAPPADVELWLKELPSHYAEWHPDHTSCEVIGQDILSAGAEFIFEETLHGEPHRLHAAVTRIDRNGGVHIEYRMLGALARSIGMKGSFRVQPQVAGSVFTATISVWPPAWLSNLLFGRQMRALAEHMREDGVNLKAILERSNPPHED